MNHQRTPAFGRRDEDPSRLRSRPCGAPERSEAASVTLFTQPPPDLLDAWDHLVASTPGSDVSQLSGWAAVRQRAGFLPLYLLAMRQDRLVGGAVVVQRPVPPLGMVGCVPYGPVIAGWAPRGATARALSAALADLACRHLGSLVVQPPEGGDDIGEDLLRLGFRPSRAGTGPRESTRIDLTVDVEALREGLSAGTRECTRAWADRGITVRLGAEPDLPLVADLAAGSAAHRRAEPISLDCLATLYQELRPRAHAQLLVAELDRVPVAAELLTGCGGVVTSWLAGLGCCGQGCSGLGCAGLGCAGQAVTSQVTAVLMWNAMLWAKANGYRAFDLGGDLGGIGNAGDFGGQPCRYPAPVELISAAAPQIGDDPAGRGGGGGTLAAMVEQVVRRGVCA